MIDLHVHSTFSDGTLTPAEIAALASETGLAAVALTDHDTTDGIASFLPACAERKVRGIAGVELSADYDKGTMHMLGYHVDPGSPVLAGVLRSIRSGRDDRNGRIIERLNKLGMKIAAEDVLKHASEDVVGRPHIAQALLDKGYVSSVKQAFEMYLGKGKPAYVDRFRLSPEASIEAIRGANGVAVLGHPVTLGIADRDLKQYVASLASAGLQGIEVYYSEHSQKQMVLFQAIAKDLGLLATGGSDFHGARTPDIRLGRGFGSLEVPDGVLGPLYEAAGRAFV